MFTFELIPLSNSSYGLNSTTTVLLQGWFCIKQPMKIDMPLNKEIETKSN